MAVEAEESLCCLISKAHWSARDSESALYLARSIEAEKFWELASFNRVEALAVKKLKPLGINIPDDIKHEVAQVERANRERRERALKLFEVWSQNHIRVFLLKGFLLGETVYSDYAYKRMNDIDILIPQEEVSRAVEIAQTRGFTFAVQSMLGKLPLDFRLHHSPPLVSPDRKLILGLHWNLASSFAKRMPRTDIFLNHNEMRVDGIRVFSLSHEVNILHLCMHLPFFKIGLRELSDVANLIIKSRNCLDFDALIDTAHKWRCEDALYRVLKLAHRAIPCLNEQEIKKLDEVSKNLTQSRYMTDTQTRIKDLKILLRSRSTYIGKVEKNYALFKLATCFRDRLFHLKEQWRLVLWVPREERARLLPGSLWFGRWRATCALCFAMMQDLGVKLFVAVTIKNLLCVFSPSRGSQVEFKAAQELLERME